MVLVAEACRNNCGLFILGKTRFSAKEWEGCKDKYPAQNIVQHMLVREVHCMKLCRRGTMNIARGLDWVKSIWMVYL